MCNLSVGQSRGPYVGQKDVSVEMPFSRGSSVGDPHSEGPVEGFVATPHNECEQVEGDCTALISRKPDIQDGH